MASNASSPPPNPVRWSVTCRGRTVVTEPCRTAFQAVELAGSELADPELGLPHFSECHCEPLEEDSPRAARLVYIAHPLGVGADRENNRRRAARWVAWAARQPGVLPIATWVTLAEVWPEDDESRAFALALDAALVARCEELWLCGGRLSPGMTKERDAATKAGVKVVDLLELGEEPPGADPT